MTTGAQLIHSSSIIASPQWKSTTSTCSIADPTSPKTTTKTASTIFDSCSAEDLKEHHLDSSVDKVGHKPEYNDYYEDGLEGEEENGKDLEMMHNRSMEEQEAIELSRLLNTKAQPVNTVSLLERELLSTQLQDLAEGLIRQETMTYQSREQRSISGDENTHDTTEDTGDDGEDDYGDNNDEDLMILLKTEIEDTNSVDICGMYDRECIIDIQEAQGLFSDMYAPHDEDLAQSDSSSQYSLGLDDDSGDDDSGNICK